MAKVAYIKTTNGWEQIGAQAQTIPQALVPVMPTSATGGSIAADGTVTFSGAASVAIDGVFTSTYDNYLVMYDVTMGAAAQVQQRVSLRAAGVTNASAVYDRGSIWNNSSTPTANMPMGTTYWSFGSSDIYRGQMTFSKPALAAATGVAHVGMEYSTTPSVNMLAMTAELYHRNTVAYDGLYWTPASGTISGSIKIYGYTKTSIFDPSTIKTPRIELTRTTDFSVSTGTYTQVTGWTQSEIRGGFSESGGTVTVPLTGRYSITFFGSWATNSTGSRVVGVAVNSDTSPTYPLSTVPAATIFTAQAANAYGIRLNAGDTLKPYVYQNSGGALAFNATGFNGGHKFIVEYLGS